MRKLYKQTYNILIIIPILLAMLWILVGSGDPWDEGEHLRITSLIYHFGLRPFSDFFEHHFINIWRLLGTYFYIFHLELDPAVMFLFGRLLVLGAFVLVLLGLYNLSKATTTQTKGLPISWALFSLYVLFTRKFFVIRPESFAFAFFVLAFAELLQNNTTQTKKIISVSLLLSISLAFTPRFGPAILAMIGFYAIQNKNIQYRQAIQLTAIIITISSAIALISMIGYLKETYIWAIKFTSTIQSIYPANPDDFLYKIWYHIQYASILPISGLIGYLLIGKKFIQNIRVRIVFAIIITLLPIFAYSGFYHVFPQGYSPIAALSLIVIAYFVDSKLENSNIKILITVSAIILIASIVSFARPNTIKTNAIAYNKPIRNAIFIAYNIPIRNAMFDVAQNKTAFLLLWEQPFNQLNPFYYASQLVCCKDRTKKAIDILKNEGFNIKPFNIGKDITTTKPELITIDWRKFVPKKEEREIEKIINKCYSKTVIPFRQECLLCGKSKLMGRELFVLMPKCKNN